MKKITYLIAGLLSLSLFNQLNAQVGTFSQIGIGTAPTGSKFVLQGGSNYQIHIDSKNNYGGYGAIGFNRNVNTGFIPDGSKSSFQLTHHQVNGVGQHDFVFARVASGGYHSDLMIDGDNGNVGIGTINPQSKLAVNGEITATSVHVTVNGWSDYVFASDYKLKSLYEVESFIQKNKHLPNIPSEKDVCEEGIDLSEMNSLLLGKIEELTLYMIQQEKKLDELQKLIKSSK